MTHAPDNGSRRQRRRSESAKQQPQSRRGRSSRRSKLSRCCRLCSRRRHAYAPLHQVSLPCMTWSVCNYSLVCASFSSLYEGWPYMTSVTHRSICLSMPQKTRWRDFLFSEGTSALADIVEEAERPRKRAKKKQEYVPGVGTANYAFLIILYQA